MMPHTELIRGFFAVLLVVLIFVSCGTQPVAGIETTNGDGTVIASGSTIEGTAPAFTRVTVASRDYTPLVERGNALMTTAGEQGRFRLEGLAAGAYSLLFSSPDERHGAQVGDVAVGPMVERTRHTFELDDVGSIGGYIAVSGDTAASVLVYLPGTALYTIVAPPDSFTIAPVPPGAYAVRAAVLSTGNLNPQVLAESGERDARVTPGVETSIGTVSLP